ncbi:MAG: FAD-binding oxidoreductase [Conexivisphaerales archaeon]
MKECDVLVIGAGILGVSSAYYIKKNNPNKHIILAERYSSAGQGNTGRSNAMCRNTFTSADNQILADASIDFYLQLNKTVDIGLQKIGYLWLLSKKQLSRTKNYVSSMRRNGIEVKIIYEEELKRKLPSLVSRCGDTEEGQIIGLPDVSGALFGPKCGRLDPDKLVRFYSEEFRRLGGLIYYNTEAERLNVKPKKELGIDGEPFVWQEKEVRSVRLKGAVSGEVYAKTVVLACGAWMNQLLDPIGIDGHVKAKKRQLFSLPASNDQLRSLMKTSGFNALGLLPMVILPKSGVHFKPVAEEEAFWVACEDEINREYIYLPDKNVDSYRAEPEYYEKGILPILRSYFPSFASAIPKAMWAGLYAYNTADYLPFVFRVNNVIAVGGDSGSGIMKGDSLGRITDAVYREERYAELYNGKVYDTERIGFERRRVEKEEWVI